jgi:hypothetical protein
MKERKRIKEELHAINTKRETSEEQGNVIFTLKSYDLDFSISSPNTYNKEGVLYLYYADQRNFLQNLGYFVNFDFQKVQLQPEL